MTLDQLKIKEKAQIIAIKSDDILKKRLYSFGITKGAVIIMEESTLTKSTINIKVNQSKIALRLNEAQKIEVKYVQ